jgi:hypothetical protein
MTAAVAAIVIAQERELIAHFRRAGAMTPASAKSLSELGVDSGMAWTRLARRAIIREAGDGLYYLDEPAWVAHQQMRKRIAMTMIAVALVAIATVALVVLTLTSARR